jgi:hypothetical protein
MKGITFSYLSVDPRDFTKTDSNVDGLGLQAH